MPGSGPSRTVDAGMSERPSSPRWPHLRPPCTTRGEPDARCLRWPSGHPLAVGLLARRGPQLLSGPGRRTRSARHRVHAAHRGDAVAGMGSVRHRGPGRAARPDLRSVVPRAPVRDLRGRTRPASPARLVGHRDRCAAVPGLAVHRGRGVVPSVDAALGRSVAGPAQEALGERLGGRRRVGTMRAPLASGNAADRHPARASAGRGRVVGRVRRPERRPARLRARRCRSSCRSSART